MGLNDAPKGERYHIAFFGKRNAGKSSLINQVTGQELAVVSQVKGTTTDPVYKAMELLPLGPVVVIDTPGIDDEGELGERRMEKTREVLHKADLAVVVMDMEEAISASRDSFSLEREWVRELTDKGIPHLIVWNKYDVWAKEGEKRPEAIDSAKRWLDEFAGVNVSAKDGIHIMELKERIASLVPNEKKKRIIGDLIKANDLVVLVTPIDSAAPKGRLILPQQQTIRDVLDAGAVALVTKEGELGGALRALKDKPRIVVTDSQAFQRVAADTPRDVPLTSFSILFARYKGELEALVEGVRAVGDLQDGDVVLMAEGCTHHRQCDDIGTVKIPRWLKEKTGKDLVFETSSGGGFPKGLEDYSLIVHCGACMLNQREMLHRLGEAGRRGVPIVNYGILIAYMNGILERSLEPFGIQYRT